MKKLYKKCISALYSFIGTFLACMMCIFVLFAAGFRIAQVSGDSMLPGLHDGDKIIVSNFLYQPEYGDIIVIGRSYGEHTSFIKRIVALQGDEISIDFDSHIITVNGYVIPEEYEVNAALSERGDLTYPVTVPDGCVFVLGDNRNNSLDSRFSEIGFIKNDEIAGKAVAKFFPPGKLK